MRLPNWLVPVTLLVAAFGAGWKWERNLKISLSLAKYSMRLSAGITSISEDIGRLLL